MIKRNSPKPAKTQSKRWPTFMLILLCGLMLVSGIFYAGRQHFSSMDYGMKNSRLRKQIDELQAEKRRLLLAREIALSPAEIKKAAIKVGFTDSPETQPEFAKMTALAKAKAIPVTATDMQTKPMIVKTASVKPAPAAVTAIYTKGAASVKPVKRTTAAAE